MNRDFIVKKVIAKLAAYTEEEQEASIDALQENKEELVKFIAKELNKKGFKASSSIEGRYIFLEVTNKDGDKFSFSEDGYILKEDSGSIVFYDENSNKNFEIKFELDEKFNFKNADITKIISHIK
jgi:hypothetical protein